MGIIGGPFVTTIAVSQLNKSSFELCKAPVIFPGRQTFGEMVTSIYNCSGHGWRESFYIELGSLIYLRLKPTRLSPAAVVASTKDCSRSVGHLVGGSSCIEI